MPVRSAGIARGAVTSAELAVAAVMASLVVVVTVIGSLIPHAGPLAYLAAFPLGLVAQRHRLKALLLCAATAALIGFALAGVGPVIFVTFCAFVGGLVGTFKRRERGVGSLAIATALLALALALLADAVLLLFSASRRLAFAQIENITKGVARILQRLGLDSLASGLRHVVGTALQYWWLTVGMLVAAAVILGVSISWVLLGALIDRLSGIATEDRLAGAGRAPSGESPAPLPVNLAGVGYHYPGAAQDALADLDLDLGPGELVAVVGPNGSGKSTLARILAGVPPTAGTVDRAGPTGLGLPGGVALVAQRPESQVLGVRAFEDVEWGLPPEARPDVTAILELVGLGGMAQRETSTLSGGELQRLAVAGALARRPALFLSDESTAMLDSAGRASLVTLLSSLPKQLPMSVVHVTHREAEAQVADRTIRLHHGRLVSGPPTEGPGNGRRPPEPPGPPAGGPVLVAKDLSHTYAARTPWAHDALHHIDLAVRAGEGMVVTGSNGSGKSTLAWVLAGLINPTGGVCELDGAPVTGQVGRVGLAFQHSRLQLQRPTVLADVQAAGGVDEEGAERALTEAGLDPARFGDMPVDRLSGGQLRRVALAGLVAGDPRAVVLDEPFAGLDEDGRRHLLAGMAGLRARGCAVVVVSHDLEPVAEVCPTAVLLVGGRVVWVAPTADQLSAAGGGDQ